MNNNNLPLIILGAGGHAKVLLSLIQATGRQVAGICDPELAKQDVGIWRGIKVIGGDDALNTLDTTTVELVNGLGQLVGGCGRQKIFEKFKVRGFNFAVLVHPAAWVDPTVVLSEGVQVMAGTIIQTDVFIGQNTIINTRASIDHDCHLGAHVHIAPGATLCGDVHVGNSAFIASGATVIQGLSVGTDAVVGAGTTLVRQLADRQMVLGSVIRKKPSSSKN